MKKYIFVISCCLNAFFLKALPDNFFIYNQSNGFEAKSINGITESYDGKIWIATEQGLWSFDGISFKNFKNTENHKTPILSNDITSVYIDNHQNLWIGYYQHGFSVWNLKNDTRKNFHNFIQSKELNSNRIMGFNQNNDKIYVFFHDTAWLEFNINSFTYKIIKPKIENFKPILFRNILYIKEFNKWYITSSDGMAEYLPDENKVIGKPYKINDKPVWKLHNSVNGVLYKNGIIYQYTWGGGIIKYDVKNNTFIGVYQYNNLEKFSGATNTVHSAEFLNDSLIWVTTPDFGIGFFNINQNKYEFYPLTTNESTTSSSYVFKDSKENFWFAHENGLMHWVKSFQNYHLMQLPLSPDPTMQRLNFFYFIKEFKNKLLTGSIQGNGVYVYNKLTFKLEKIIKFRGLLPNQTFRTLQAFEYNGILFINSWSGLFTLNIEKEEWKRFEFNGIKELENSIYRCVRIKNNQLLLGFYDSKVGYFNLETQNYKIWTENDVKNDIATFKNSQIYELVLDENNNIVASHDGGISLFNIKNFKIKQFSYLLDNKTYSDFGNMAHISIDNLGFIWTTSDASGILKIDPKNNYKIVKKFNQNNGLSSNSIDDMHVDENGNIWAVQGRFIIKIDSKKETVYKWNKDNGLQYEPAGWSVIKSNGDRLFYGRLNEIASVNKSQLENQLKEKNTFYIDYLVNKDLKYTQNNFPEKLVLSYDKNSFNLKIGSRNLLLNKHNQIKYRLNKNEEWITIEKLNEISISNIAPGNYNFEISYTNHVQTTWSSPIPLFKFKVKYPFYLQWWFISSIVVISTLIVYYFYRVKMQKQQLKTDYERKIEELQLEALRSQMNPHFLFNSLNSINYYIIKNEPQKASDYLKKFSKLIRNILNHSKNDKVSLQEELEINKLYIDLEKMRFNQSFDYILKNNSKINFDELMIPSMLLQPFIENAIWHGLMHKKEKGCLEIIISDFEKNILTIEIIDNGVGREEASILKSKTAQTQKSYGSEITINRIHHFNSVQSEIEINYSIIDLFSNEQKSEGTKVIITIKYQNGKF